MHPSSHQADIAVYQPRAACLQPAVRLSSLKKKVLKMNIKFDRLTVFVNQSALLYPGGFSGILRAIRRLLFVQCAAFGAASAAHLLGLSHPTHGLQVCVPGEGEKRANEN